MLQKVVRPVPFLDARWNQCRWPLWEKAGDPQLVCGGPALPGKSYCREHMELSRLRGHRGPDIVQRGGWELGRGGASAPSPRAA